MLFILLFCIWFTFSFKFVDVKYFIPGYLQVACARSLHILYAAHVVVIVFKYSMPSMGRWLQRDADVGAGADAHALRIITTKSNK